MQRSSLGQARCKQGPKRPLMGNSGDLLEVTPGLSQPVVNGLLIAILIERVGISCAMFSFVRVSAPFVWRAPCYFAFVNFDLWKG